MNWRTILRSLKNRDMQKRLGIVLGLLVAYRFMAHIPVPLAEPTQLRTMLGLNDTAKNKKALKEVIVGAQNGKLYFLDLVTGEATREAIAVDWPSNGAVSLQTNASPMLAVGQHIGVLA